MKKRKKQKTEEELVNCVQIVGLFNAGGGSSQVGNTVCGGDLLSFVSHTSTSLTLNTYSTAQWKVAFYTAIECYCLSEGGCNKAHEHTQENVPLVKPLTPFFNRLSVYFQTP